MIVTIDWNAPIEAVHTDGRVEAVTLRSDVPDAEGDYRTNEQLRDDVLITAYWTAEGLPSPSVSAQNMAWRIRNVAAPSVDWSRPIEAVSADDGTVISVTLIKTEPEENQKETRKVSPEVAPYKAWFNEDGTRIDGKWTIRNVTPATQSPTPDHIARMTALVEAIVAGAVHQDGKVLTMEAERAALAEARAILTAMKPVDPDIAAARELYMADLNLDDEDREFVRSGGSDSNCEMVRIIAAITKGRELERGE